MSTYIPCSKCKLNSDYAITIENTTKRTTQHKNFCAYHFHEFGCNLDYENHVTISWERWR